MEFERELAAVATPGLLRRSYPWLRTALQLAFAGALLTGLLLRVDRAAVREQLADADLWWLPLAFAANIGSDWFRAVRWQQLFAPMRRLPVPFLFGTALVGVATNIALPLRAGEVLRVQVVRRRSGLGAASIVATLVSEKLLDIVAFSSFIIVGLILYEEAHFLWPLGVAYGALVVAGVIGARYLARRAEERDGPPAEKPGFRGWLSREFHSFAAGLKAFRRPSALFHTIWSSHAAWLVEALAYYAFGRAIGLDLSPAVYLLVVVAATIAVSVPVTQAGLGVFELAITGILVAFGVDVATAAAYSIFAHVFYALPYIICGPLAAMSLKLSLSDVFFLRGGRPAEAGPAID